MAPKRSQIWQFSTGIDENKAKCNFCTAEVSTKSGSTGNLLRHCRAAHPSIPLPSSSSKANKKQAVVTPANDEVQVSDAFGGDLVAESSETRGCSAISTASTSTNQLTGNKQTKQSLIKQY